VGLITVHAKHNSLVIIFMIGTRDRQSVVNINVTASGCLWPIAGRRRSTLSPLCGHTSTTWWMASPRPLPPLTLS